MTATLQYPRFVEGQLDPKGNEVMVRDEAEHISRFPQDHQKSLEELSGRPRIATVDEAVREALAGADAERNAAVEAAVAAERERCAKVAEALHGKYGGNIAKAIRGEQIDTTIGA